jgi:aryl-alcohol dehydrogenase-like predicted oxidoreductase
MLLTSAQFLRSIGLNTWDTANAYSNGISKTIIATAIRTFDIHLHKLIIMTKCNFAVGEEPSVHSMFYPDLVNRRDHVNQGGKWLL